MKNFKQNAEKFHTVGKAGTVEIDGVKLAYWRHGKGDKTLVLIHGNSACKEVFHNQFTGLKNTQIIAFDLPGHGCSSDAANPSVQYTISGYALLLKRALDALEISNYLVYGWSLGGHIGLEMAGRGFDLAGLMISGTPPAGPGPAEVMQAFLPVEAGEFTMAVEATDAQTKMFTEAVYGSLSPIPELFYAAAARTDGVARATMGGDIIAGEYGCHQRTVAAGWAKPMACAHGKNDVFINPDYLYGVPWGNLFEGAISEFETGHAPFLEDPDNFNDLLMRFTDKVYG